MNFKLTKNYFISCLCSLCIDYIDYVKSYRDVIFQLISCNELDV